MRKMQIIKQGNIAVDVFERLENGFQRLVYKAMKPGQSELFVSSNTKTEIVEWDKDALTEAFHKISKEKFKGAK